MLSNVSWTASGWYLFYPPGEEIPVAMEYRFPSNSFFVAGPFSTEDEAWIRVEEIVAEMMVGYFAAT